ncbi:MAG: hypothetical protein HUN05_02020 [Desulfobacter sp.]|nr:MAG: hypothetical protein HUN05_02020 [Desulfobacter sp.]
MDARKQAMAELSAIFESRVVSRFTSVARSSLAADQAEIFEKEMESKVRIASDVRLQGARIGKTWQDDASGLFYALAVLDKADAGRTWTSRLELVDNQIQAEAGVLETMEGRLSRMAALNRIMALALDRQVLESRLRVVDYPVEAFTGVDLGAVMDEQAALKSEIRLHILVQGESGSRVKEIIAQGLSRKGIALVHDPGAANAQILGMVEVSPMSLKNATTRFVRARAVSRYLKHPNKPFLSRSMKVSARDIQTRMRQGTGP